MPVNYIFWKVIRRTYLLFVLWNRQNASKYIFSNWIPARHCNWQWSRPLHWIYTQKIKFYFEIIPCERKWELKTIVQNFNLNSFLFPFPMVRYFLQDCSPPSVVPSQRHFRWCCISPNLIFYWRDVASKLKLSFELPNAIVNMEFWRVIMK